MPANGPGPMRGFLPKTIPVIALWPLIPLWETGSSNGKLDEINSYLTPPRAAEPSRPTQFAV